MPSTYVPPHMREAVAGDIGVSFNSVSMNQREYSLREIQNQFGNTPSSVRTLNKSASGALSYILLFGDEHKDWPSQMFCKSNLHLLPEDLAVPGAQHKMIDGILSRCILSSNNLPIAPAGLRILRLLGTIS
jgi:hypothetical protein